VAIIAAGPQAWVNRVVLSNRVAVWFGLISYPLYLWHWPLLSFARIVEEGVPGRTIRIGAVVLSVVLAWLTYRWLERPMRTTGRGRLKVAALVALMVMAGYTGYNAYQRNGLPFRLKELNRVAEMFSYQRPARNAQLCGNRFPELAGLEFTPPSAECSTSALTPPTLVLIGDSHAGQFGNALWETFPDETLMVLTRVQCLPFINAETMDGKCRETYETAIRFLENSASIKTVILSGYWAYLLSGGFEASGEHWRIPRAPTARQIESFKSHATQFLTRVLAAGKTIIWLKDVPDLDFNIRQCFDYRPWRLTSGNVMAECWIDEGAFRRRVRPTDDVVEEVLARFPAVKVFDPRPLLCRDGKCFATDGTMPYYFDGDHLSIYGTRMVMSALAAQQFRRP